MDHRRQLGNNAEELVAHQLKRLGFAILERNYTRPYGEIDLIASTKSLIVFVEVKMRTHTYFDLAQVVTTSKQRKIIKTAQDYLARNNVQKACRFDVALVHGEGENSEIEYLEDAFRGQEYYF